MVGYSEIMPKTKKPEAPFPKLRKPSLIRFLEGLSEKGPCPIDVAAERFGIDEQGVAPLVRRYLRAGGEKTTETKPLITRGTHGGAATWEITAAGLRWLKVYRAWAGETAPRG